VLDLWHYMRGRPDDELLRSLPGDRIGAVQLCDAPASVPPGMAVATEGLNHRLMPGNGDFPITRILEILRSTGGLNNIGIEVFSGELDRMTAIEIGTAARRILDREVA